MKRIYLDNAATTPLAPEVIEVMLETMKQNFGNPSSTHQYGRAAKNALETARKNIAKHFNISAAEIIFTSSGTEADNLILLNAVTNLGVKRFITSKVEHHAVLHTLNNLKSTYDIEVDYVSVLPDGSIDLAHLEELLAKNSDVCLVSLMMVNNEVGTLLPLKEVGEICKKFDAFFHSDTVQGVGHYTIDLSEINIDFIVASAHKFHGPKGVGFAYFKKGIGIKPMLHGGSQEKGARSSTENLHSIIGMSIALDLAYENLEKDKRQIQELKTYFIDKIKDFNPKIEFNGSSADQTKSSYTIVNIRFPFVKDLFLFELDMQGIAVSGGSACQSGSNTGSHVLAELNKHLDSSTSIRFSFSRYTTQEEIDKTIEIIKKLNS